MELPQIETLLLQEMAEVKGGGTGVCECKSGAGNSVKDDGKCTCEKGAAQQITETPTPVPGGGLTPVPGGEGGGGTTCLCTAGAGQNGKG